MPPIDEVAYQEFLLRAANGLTIEQSGLSPRQFYRWLDRARKNGYEVQITKVFGGQGVFTVTKKGD
jgi:DNA-binding PadR family transcriptional regulator